MLVTPRVKKIVKKKFARTYEFQYLKNIKSKKIKENNVLLESTHARDFSGHVLYVCKELSQSHSELNLIVAINEDRKSWAESIIARHGLTNKVQLVEFLSKDYIEALATSKYLINDTTFWSFFNKRPEQIYINIWHGTPLKKLGKHMSLDGFGNVQKNFLSSDFLVVSNEYTKEKLVDGYNLNNIANTKVLVAPSSRNSILFDNNVREDVRNSLKITDKKVYMYMPTYRDEGTSISYTEDALIQLNNELSENEILYVKLHPFDAENLTLDLTELERVEIFPEQFETYEFLTSVDTLITDYSSIMYDFMCTDRSVILFTYDKEEYYRYRGIYEDINTYPFIKANNIEELKSSLRLDSPSIDNAFKNKYVGHDNLTGTKELIEYIFDKKSTENVTEFSLRNDKDNVMFFAGPLWDNGISKAFFNTLDSIDLEEKNYILYVKDNAVKHAHKYKLDQLAIPYVLSSGIAQYNLIEGLFTHLYLKYERFGNRFMRKSIEKIILPMYRLDFRRMFNNLTIDHFIHYTGFERSLAVMLQAISGNKTKTSIFYHTDIFEEYKAKKNVNRKALRNCYEVVDQVIIVNAELKERLVSNFPKIKSVKVLDNFLGTKKIIEDSDESLFSSLLNAPITYFGGVQHAIHEVLPDSKKEEVSLTPSEISLKKVIQQRNIGLSDIVPNVILHQEELNTVFNHTYQSLFKSDKTFNITNEELGHIYGISKLCLIDDLLNEDIQVYANVGRFDRQKGHDRLIAAFEKVNSKHPNTRLVIVAPHGPLKNETIKLARSSSSSSCIYIVGGMSNPYSLLKHCQAFVFTSIYEGLGLVVFESLAVGTDVITVSIPATNDGLAKGQTGDKPIALVVENDEESIIEGWLEYINTPQDFGKYDFDKVENESLQSWKDIIKPL